MHRDGGSQRGSGFLWALGTSLLLAACGGDDESTPPGGNPGAANPPQILAGVHSFPAGQVPPGFGSAANNSTASVQVKGADGVAIADAIVNVNGTALQFRADPGIYHGQLNVPPGTDVHVQVHVNGASHSLSGRQLDGYPVLLTPASDAVWSADQVNTVTWQHPFADPATSQTLSVIGRPPVPQLLPFQLVYSMPSSVDSFAIPADELPEGEHLVMLTVSRAVVPAGAPAGSALSLGAGDWRSVTVAPAGN